MHRRHRSRGARCRCPQFGALFVGAANARDVDYTGAELVASPADRGALAGADLSGVNLAGFDFLGEPLDLTGTKLDGATLTNANFPLARLAGATLDERQRRGGILRGRRSVDDADRLQQQTSRVRTPTCRAPTSSNADDQRRPASWAPTSPTPQFNGARGVDTDFSGVRAHGAIFSGAHLYGNGQAFDDATDMGGVDFTRAVLAADGSESGGFDLTGRTTHRRPLRRAPCASVAIWPTPRSNQATLHRRLLPRCRAVGSHADGRQLRSGLALLRQPHQRLVHAHDAAVSAADVGLAAGVGFGRGVRPGAVRHHRPDGSGSRRRRQLPTRRAGPEHRQAARATCCRTRTMRRVLPAPCSASAYGACPTATSTLFQSSATVSPLAVALAAPPRWNTDPLPDGYYVGFDDATVRARPGRGDVQPSPAPPARRAPPPPPRAATAVRPRRRCSAAPAGWRSVSTGRCTSLTPSCGGCARSIRRVSSRRLPARARPVPAGRCGDGAAATSAQLTAANAVAVDTHGALLIADGTAGVRRVSGGGIITTLAPGTATGDVVSVAQSGDGTVYAATRNPDHDHRDRPDQRRRHAGGRHRHVRLQRQHRLSSGSCSRAPRCRSTSRPGCRSISTATWCSPTPPTT